MNFVKTPYLPQKSVVCAVADIKSEEMNIIKPFEHKRVNNAIKKHADLTLCYLGDGVAVCEREAYEYYKKELDFLNMTLIQGEKTLDMHYPFDAAYNVAIVGKRMFCRIDSTDKVLINQGEKMGYKIVNINQGYSKCSVCPVDEMSAISADISFKRAAEKEGIEVLLITNDTVLLPGFNNGFFGGCAYMESKNCFTAKGDLKLHPDYEKIKDFLYRKGIEIKTNLPGALYDFGSFLPITEE